MKMLVLIIIIIFKLQYKKTPYNKDFKTKNLNFKLFKKLLIIFCY